MITIVLLEAAHHLAQKCVKWAKSLPGTIPSNVHLSVTVYPGRPAQVNMPCMSPLILRDIIPYLRTLQNGVIPLNIHLVQEVL